MRTLFLTLAALVAGAITPLAHADEIDRRIQARRERSEAEASVKVRQWQVDENAARIRAFQSFAAQHGGTVDAGTCTVRTRQCGYYPDSNVCPYVAATKTSFSSLDPAGDYVIDSCRLTLADGLACEVKENRDRDNIYKADCYDRAGEYSRLDVSANGRRAPVEKAIHVGGGKCSYECRGSDRKRYIYRTSYCPAWSFAEELANGTTLYCNQ